MSTRRFHRVGAAERHKLAAALDREGVVAASLFGSQATGLIGPLSDVDIAIWVDPELDPKQRLTLRSELSRAATAVLGTDEVDLVLLNDAPPLFKHRAMSGAVRLIERDPVDRVRLETAALLEYFDTAPLRKELRPRADDGLRRAALVDAERIDSRLDRLEHLIELLDEVRAGGLDAYLADERLRAMTERWLQLAIQTCIDIGAQLVSELAVEPPADYAGVFRSLAAAGHIESISAIRSRRRPVSATSWCTCTWTSTTARCSAPSIGSTICATFAAVAQSLADRG